MKIGLFVNGMKVCEFDISDYAQALQELNYVYEETEIPHELKFI